MSLSEIAIQRVTSQQGWLWEGSVIVYLLRFAVQRAIHPNRVCYGRVLVWFIFCPRSKKISHTPRDKISGWNCFVLIVMAHFSTEI